jgi:hypothetical protein
MVLNKYSAALLQIAIIVIGAYSILQTPVSAVAAWGLVVLAAQAVVTYLVPVLTGRWAGGFKTGAAIVIAVVGTLIPLIAQGGHLLPSQVAILILSGLNALAARSEFRSDSTPPQRALWSVTPSTPFLVMTASPTTVRRGTPMEFENVEGIQVPVDPMDLLQCDSCQ